MTFCFFFFIVLMNVKFQFSWTPFKAWVWLLVCVAFLRGTCYLCKFRHSTPQYIASTISHTVGLHLGALGNCQEEGNGMLQPVGCPVAWHSGYLLKSLSVSRQSHRACPDWLCGQANAGLLLKGCEGAHPLPLTIWRISGTSCLPVAQTQLTQPSG